MLVTTAEPERDEHAVRPAEHEADGTEERRERRKQHSGLDEVHRLLHLAGRTRRASPAHFAAFMWEW